MEILDYYYSMPVVFSGGKESERRLDCTKTYQKCIPETDGDLLLTDKVQPRNKPDLPVRHKKATSPASGICPEYLGFYTISICSC